MNKNLDKKFYKKAVDLLTEETVENVDLKF